MIKKSKWIWQRTEWPIFTYDHSLIAPELAKAHHIHGLLEGKSQAILHRKIEQISLDTLCDEVFSTAAIEGEGFPIEAVHASVMRKKGLILGGPVNRWVDGLIDVVTDAVVQAELPLDAGRLCRWQSALFPGETFRSHQIAVGKFRDAPGPMRIVSGMPGHEVIHYEAPLSSNVRQEMKQFLEWFNATSPAKVGAKQEAYIDGFARAAIAHLWFESIHPFEDGNGRVGRAILSMAMAQYMREPFKLYSLSSQLLKAHGEYYEALNSAQCGEMNVSDWVKWFTDQSSKACAGAFKRVDKAIAISHFWEKAEARGLRERQKAALRYALEVRDTGDGLNAEKYMSLTGVSKATATRDLSAMVGSGQLRTLGVGKALRYFVNFSYAIDDRTVQAQSMWPARA